MQLCCPACGFKSPIETFAADKDARHFAALMGRVPPPLSDLVLRYLGLFAPAKHAMTFSKGRAVLEPLVVLIEQGRITRAKREWPVSLSGFEHGLQHMVDRRASLTLPLKSHGYLLEVLAGAADKVEAQSEAQEIARQRTGETRKAAEEANHSEAAQWDDSRRLQAARVAAVSALHAEIAGLKRLGLTPTRELLIDTLIKSGHARPAVDFAFTKVSLE